ncbi:ISKra4 family transposase, partial [Microcoleus sp. C2C3]
MSPHLENCCLRLSANVAYQNAAKDIEYITGITVPAKTQQRLVHYQKFEQPVATADITELSADGGKARLIRPLGEKSEWKDYKAIVSEAGIVASFEQNEMIVNWANQQPLALTSNLSDGDGHDGVWNIFKEISCEQDRREILDWYHLNENLQKVGGSIKRLKQAETYLWKGNVKSAKALSCYAAKPDKIALPLFLIFLSHLITI